MEINSEKSVSFIWYNTIDLKSIGIKYFDLLIIHTK